MNVYAISDLHLSGAKDKPMNIFGNAWEGHMDKIIQDWNSKVNDEDLVLIAGDISWAMKLEDAKIDLDLIASLKGKKIIIRGNHDYWWSSITRVRNQLQENMYAVQNDCLRIEDYLICGSRGWNNESNHEEENDTKIYERELIRLELSLQEMERKRKDGDKVIGMIHYPPYNPNYQESKITNLFTKYKVDKVVYGHIHLPCRVNEKNININDVDYILTSCDLVKNKLIKIY